MEATWKLIYLSYGPVFAGNDEFCLEFKSSKNSNLRWMIDYKGICILRINK
jgi:hypothetical protein